MANMLNLLLRRALPGLLFLPSCALHAAGQDALALADLSLEALSEVVVTSVSRQETRLSEASASLYVISASDIARSGATTLPEALRLAPNLQVARIDAHNYAIGARGFSAALANKLLVLIDGRSVYSPLFSGVFWDMQDVVMSDIARIEVISGPGASIWGANAVNGVINIITRHASRSQGSLLVARAGDHGRSITARHGGRLGNGAYYRVYAKSGWLSDTENEAGTALAGGGRRRQAGFRLDWGNARGEFTVSGDIYAGVLGAFQPADVGGANLLGRWETRAAGSALRVQAYLDHTRRDQQGVGSQRLDTFDIEAQHGLTLGRHKLAWGGGHRFSRDRITNGPVYVFTPARRDLRWSNLFVQDEIGLTSTLEVTAGLKLEHNVYTGLETLPSLRLAWRHDPRALVWAAASRTVRAPARIDRDLMVLDPAAGAGAPRYAIAGGPNFVSETAEVLELGYRAQPHAWFSYSATVFDSRYDRLRTLEPVPGQSPVFANRGRGRARGLEMWATWQALRGWRLAGGAVLQRIRTRLEPGSGDLSGGAGLATNDPNSYWSLRSSHELGPRLRADLLLRRVGSLPQPAVPGYHELDARLAWQVRPELELALAGRNLLNAAHAEFGEPGTRQMFERTVFATATMRF